MEKERVSAWQDRRESATNERMAYRLALLPERRVEGDAFRIDLCGTVHQDVEPTLGLPDCIEERIDVLR